MRNQKLAEDYITRAEKRIFALKALIKVQAWADVVREAQECVELALKSLLRTANIEVPRVHDVSDIFIAHKSLLPKAVLKDLSQLIEISRRMRRDRELAFYGTEDLTPSEFYKEDDAQKAFTDTEFVVKVVKPLVLGKGKRAEG